MTRGMKISIAALLLLLTITIVRFATIDNRSRIVVADVSFIMGKFTVNEIIDAGFTPYPEDMTPIKGRLSGGRKEYALPIEKDGVRLLISVLLDDFGEFEDRVIREFAWSVNESSADFIKMGGFTVRRGMRESEIPILRFDTVNSRGTWYSVKNSPDGTIDTIYSRQRFAPFFTDGFLYIPLMIISILCLFHGLFMPRLSRPAAFFRNEIDNMIDRAGKPLKRFRIDRQLMKNMGKGKSIGTKERAIRTLMASIIEHMGLSQSSLELFIVHSSLDSFQSGFGCVGQYQHYTNKASEIELTLRTDYNAWNIAAILAHECAHHWIIVNNLHSCDAETLEYRTDIATIHTGFKKVIKKGYAEKTKTVFGMIQTYRIGYLSQADFEFVLSLLTRR
jgi:hypothetical protein